MLLKKDIDKILYFYRILSLIILLLIFVFLPSILIAQNSSYSIFYTFFIGIYIIIFILTSKMHISVKVILCLIIISLYRINFKFMIELILKVTFLCNTTPISIRKDDQIPRSIVTKIFSSNFKLHTQFDKLPSFPSIIICNYCKSRVENIACIMLPLNMAIVLRGDGFISNLDKLVKWTIFTKDKDCYEDTKTQIKYHIDSGRSVFVYITKPPKTRLNLLSYMRSGTFNIAKELNIPITLVCIDYVDTCFESITRQNFRIHVGDTFMVENVQESKYKSKLFFTRTLTEFIRRKYE